MMLREMGQFLKDVNPRKTRPSWWNMLVAIPLLGVSTSLFYSARSDWDVAKRQQITWGIVKTHEPSKHDRYGYSFTVNGHAFTGWTGSANHDLHIGQTVIVYYDPVDPANNMPGDFRGAGDRGFAFGFWPILGIGLLALSIHLSRRGYVGGKPPESRLD
jgi:hypothetical protein